MCPLWRRQRINATVTWSTIEAKPGPNFSHLQGGRVSTSTIFDAAHTAMLFNDLKKANTEAAKKERFIQYLTRTFSQDQGAQSLISAMTLGAERVIANIPRGATFGRGRADTQTETVIIEWEKDLSKTGEHARDQLAEYLQGNWRSGQEYRFILLTTDGLRWRRFAPDWSKVEMGKLAFDKSFTLKEVRRFDLTSDNLGDFPFFLDEVLFANQQRFATLERISSDFGDTSTVFINSVAALERNWRLGHPIRAQGRLRTMA
jgi:hypothetical protein